jgi:hypothetical protein
MTNNHRPSGATPELRDERLYVAQPEGWTAKVKRGSDKEHCYAQHPGEDFFHLLIRGEIYLQHGTEKYCLSCARRLEIVTEDRLHWQHRGT